MYMIVHLYMYMRKGLGMYNVYILTLHFYMSIYKPLCEYLLHSAALHLRHC